MPAASEILALMARDGADPVIGDFGLYALAIRLFKDQGYAGVPLPPRNRALTERRARELIHQATADYAHTPTSRLSRLPRDPDFSSVLYITAQASAPEVMLAADPFCCLSHGSALAFHGLLNASTDLHVILPDRATWQAKANRMMAAAIGFPPEEANPGELPFRLTRPAPRETVRGMPVYRHQMRHHISWTSKGRIRATAIGETFRDTLDNPAWCGGIDAVIGIWRKHAGDHREAIIKTISNCTEKILRVRAGYLLDEMLEIKDSRIEAWIADAQRGSSRKLDAAAPYGSSFSARWMLSINVPNLGLPSTTR